MASRSSEGIYAQTLAVFDRSEYQYEPLTTPEVAEALDVNRRTVYKRLRKLVDRGELETKETGSNSRVWWRAPREVATPGRARDEKTDESDSTGRLDRNYRHMSERKKRQQEDEQTANRFRNLFEQLSQPVVEVEFEDFVPVVRDVNPAFEETFGHDSATIVGESLDEYIVPESEKDEARELNDRLTSGENLASTEVTRQTADGLREFRIDTAMYEDAARGFGIYTDITERKDRERDLRAANRFNEELVENAPFGMFRLDDRLRITYENPRAEEIIGLPEEKEQSDAIGMDIRELPPIVETGQADIFSRVQEGETVEFEFPFESIYSKSAYFTGRCVPLFRDAEFDGAILMAKDISERKQREDALRRQNERMAELVEKHEVAETRYQSLFENSPVVIWEQDFSSVKDRLEDLKREVDCLETYLGNNRDVLFSLLEDIEFIDVNEKAFEYYGIDSKEELFEKLLPLLTEEIYEMFATQFAKMASGETNFSLENRFQSFHGETRDELVHVAIPEAYTDDWSRVFVTATDITEQKEYERELERMRDFLREAERLGRLGAWEFDESGEAYWTEGTRRIHGVDDAFDPAVDAGIEFYHPEDRESIRDAVEGALERGEAYDVQARLITADGNERWIRTGGKPLDDCRDNQRVRGFIQDITEQKEYERDLERQREQLAALNELNDVVRGITHAVVEQSTREEIEHVVAERLAASNSYEFAWVVAGDSPGQLQPRVEAGIEGYLADGTAAPDPDSNSPTRKAVETGELHVSRNLIEDSDSELSQYARAHGYRSVAAIPIVHGGTLYGVIGVHSERPDAFAHKEREVIGELGEVVGHAIAALNRKRALMNDELVELHVRIPDVMDVLDGQEQSHGTIALERYIPLADETFLLYGTATADAVDHLHTMCEQQPHWVGVQTIDEFESLVRFELEVSNPPVASTVADHGGYFEDARIEDGEFRSTIYLPPGTSVRSIVEQIRETYPDFEVTSQKQVTHEGPLQHHLLERFSQELTEKQKRALEVAYHGGFFNWPRDMSGEEIAASLDIGASTFHHHIRKAEQKLLDVVFADFGGPGG